MHSKKYILPIFLLYTLSSMFFLIGFATMYYKEAKSKIVEHHEIHLERFSKELEYLLRLNNNIDNIMKLKSIYLYRKYDYLFKNSQQTA